MSIGLIVLAAGGSTRMGTAKQLLQYNGKTLIRRAAETALETGCSPVIVVIGQDAGKMRRELDGLSIIAALNSDWELGMGGSLRMGMHHLQDYQGCDAVLVTLCDQPLVSTPVLLRLLKTYQEKRPPLAAASYAGTLGVPAIFSRPYFSSLQELPMSGGAKQLLAQHASDVLPVTMAEAAIDVDTPLDYQRLSIKS